MGSGSRGIGSRCSDDLTFCDCAGENMKKRKIKIIGDSLAAGGGSSLCRKTDVVVFEDNGIQYLKCVAPNSWWGLLQTYFRQNGDNYLIDNMGCGGAYSYQINHFLDRLVEEDDDLVLILMGVNDRKRINGMEELRVNCESVIDRLRDVGKEVVLLTPTPSVHSNEYYPNRIHHTDHLDAVCGNAPFLGGFL